MNIAAIIPARGGSKGIRKKNIVAFRGAPLITHTIRQANQADRIDDVYVSTDDEQIAETSQAADATVIERPDRIATDESATESALLHALETLADRDRRPDIVVLLQCTSPLRRDGDIDEAVSLVADGRYNSALSCCEDHKFYWRYEDGTAVPINYDPQNRARRQDLSTRYQENGSIYVTESDTLTATGCRLGGDRGLYEMPRSLSFEIDEPADLRIVDAMATVTNEDLLLVEDWTENTPMRERVEADRGD